MANQKQVAAQLRRLETHRESLRKLLQRATLDGGLDYAPIEITNQIESIRGEIQHLKVVLRAAGSAVPDEADDDPPPEPASALIPQATPILPTVLPSSTPPADSSVASCFISYSHQDEAFAAQLVARLRAAGVSIWYATDDMQGGAKLHEQIGTAIQRQDKLLLVLSTHSLASRWVETEIRRARRLEDRTGQRKLFPIRLVDMEALREWECFDADWGKDLAVEVREYFIPDFSAWQNLASFEAAFARLVRDLGVNQGTS